MSSIKIVLLEDHKTVLDAYCQAFENCTDIQIFTTFHSRSKFLKEGFRIAHKIDVLIMDLMVDGEFSYDLLKIWKLSFPQVAVMMLSAFCSDIDIIKAANYGVDAYLSKVESFDTVVNTVRAIYKGEKVFPVITKRSQYKIHENMVAIISKLNDRHIEFIQHLASAKTYADIAIEMNLSIKTIEGYRHSLVLTSIHFGIITIQQQILTLKT